MISVQSSQIHEKLGTTISHLRRQLDLKKNQLRTQTAVHQEEIQQVRNGINSFLNNIIPVHANTTPESTWTQSQYSTALIRCTRMQQGKSHGSYVVGTE